MLPPVPGPAAHAARTMSNIHYLHLRPRDQPALDAIPEDVRREVAIAFLASDRPIAELVADCAGSTAEAASSRATLACVLLMVREDAPEDLILYDPRLYSQLRERITELRISGWIAPDP